MSRSIICTHSSRYLIAQSWVDKLRAAIYGDGRFDTPFSNKDLIREFREWLCVWKKECRLYRSGPLVGAVLSAEPYLTVRQSTWELIVATYPPKDDLANDGQILAAHTLKREPENFADDKEVVESVFVEGSKACI